MPVLKLPLAAVDENGMKDDAARLLADSPDAISRLAADGTFLFASGAAKSVLGRDPEELIGTSVLDIVEPVDRGVVLARLRSMAAGEVERSRLTGRVRLPGGHYVWVDSTGAVVVDRDTGERTIVMVSRRAEAERALARLEERFREIVEWMPAVVYESEVGEGGFLYISPQIEQLLGYTAEEWVDDQHAWENSLHPDDHDRVIELEKEQAAHSAVDSDQIAAEYRMIHRNGRVVHVRDVARITGAATGEAFWRGVIVDITGERSADSALREAHDSYRQMVDSLPACVYRAETGHNGAWAYISSQIERLLGYTAAEIEADPTLWAASLHADDRQRVERDESALTALPPGSQYVNEYRMRTRTGRMIWVRDRAVLTEAEDGRLMMDGLLVDITAERHSEPPAGSSADIYRLACADCGNAWPAERLEPCGECGGINVDGVSLNATLGELAESRRQVEGLLDGIHRHLEALGTNLRSVSDQLSFGVDAGDPGDTSGPEQPD